MKDKYGWALHKVQKPIGFHLVLSESNCVRWQGFLTDLKSVLDDMKKDPSLNHSHETAVYGAAGMIPDKKFLNEFLIIHAEELLEVQK